MRLRSFVLAAPFVLGVGYLLACSGGSGTTGSSSSTGASGSALDGTWDIVSYGDGEIGPSSYATFANGKLSGQVSASEPSGCTAKLEFAFEGDSMVGVYTPGGSCAGDDTLTLNGTRTVREPDSDTPWNGTWHVTSDRQEDDIVISGLTAKAHDPRDFTLTIAGGLATATGDRELSFVARRR